ncbi:MAG: cupredoxin domain-containing protein [Ramlibacter sp.]
MNIHKSTLSAFATACALALAAGAAFAHGNQDDGKPAAAAAKEQKPWGIAGDARNARRTIEIAMTDDMRFTPSSIEVRQGETVKFVVRNKGKVLHEMVIGDRKTLDEHAALMARFPAMEHDEPYMAHVAAGKQGTLVWNFNRAGDFDFACLIAGHYQAGMVGRIKVVAGRAQ